MKFRLSAQLRPNVRDLPSAQQFDSIVKGEWEFSLGAKTDFPRQSRGNISRSEMLGAMRGELRRALGRIS